MGIHEMVLLKTRKIRISIFSLYRKKIYLIFKFEDRSMNKLEQLETGLSISLRPYITNHQQILMMSSMFGFSSSADDLLYVTIKRILEDRINEKKYKYSKV